MSNGASPFAIKVEGFQLRWAKLTTKMPFETGLDPVNGGPRGSS
jgi:hypothetical protein